MEQGEARRVSGVWRRAIAAGVVAALASALVMGRAAGQGNLCTLTGNLSEVSGQPAANVRVYFKSVALQTYGGAVIGPSTFSVLTDSQGNLPTNPPLTIPQGALVLVTVGSGQPVQIQIPLSASADLSTLMLANSDPPSLVTGLGIGAGGDFALSVTNPPVGGVGTVTLQPGRTTGLQGVAVAASVPLAGQFLVQNAAANQWVPVTLSGDLSASVANPGQVAVSQIAAGGSITANNAAGGPYWISGYGVNGVRNALSLNEDGTLAGGVDTIWSATATAGNPTLSNLSGHDFKVGEGVQCYHCGTTETVATPAAVSGAAVCGSAGGCATQYQYAVAILDGHGGISAASAASTAVSNQVPYASGCPSSGNYDCLSLPEWFGNSTTVTVATSEPAGALALANTSGWPASCQSPSCAVVVMGAESSSVNGQPFPFQVLNYTSLSVNVLQGVTGGTSGVTIPVGAWATVALTPPANFGNYNTFALPPMPAGGAGYVIYRYDSQSAAWRRLRKYPIYGQMQYSSAAVTLPASTIPMASTVGFMSSGTAVIGGAVGNGGQVVTYSGITATSLTGVSGGSGSFPAGALVFGQWPVGRELNKLQVTAGSPVIYTGGTPQFVPSDVGQTVTCIRCGSGGANLSSTIVTVVDSQNAVMAADAQVNADSAQAIINNILDYGGQNIDDYNLWGRPDIPAANQIIPPTPPSAALADSMFSQVTATSASTITLATAPSQSLTGVTLAHDDTAALQSAIEHAGRDQEVVLPPGVYPEHGLVLGASGAGWLQGLGYALTNNNFCPSGSESQAGGFVVMARDISRAVLEFNGDPSDFVTAGVEAAGGGPGNNVGSTLRNLGIWMYSSGGAAYQNDGTGALLEIDNVLLCDPQRDAIFFNFTSNPNAIGYETNATMTRFHALNVGNNFIHLLGSSAQGGGWFDLNHLHEFDVNFVGTQENAGTGLYFESEGTGNSGAAGGTDFWHIDNGHLFGRPGPGLSNSVAQGAHPIDYAWGGSGNTLATGWHIDSLEIESGNPYSNNLGDPNCGLIYWEPGVNNYTNYYFASASLEEWGCGAFIGLDSSDLATYHVVANAGHVQLPDAAVAGGVAASGQVSGSLLNASIPAINLIPDSGLHFGSTFISNSGLAVSGPGPDGGNAVFTTGPYYSTTLSSGAAQGATSLTVGSTTGFPSSGTLVTQNSYFSYTGTTATSFTGLSPTLPWPLASGTGVYMQGGYGEVSWNSIPVSAGNYYTASCYIDASQVVTPSTNPTCSITSNQGGATLAVAQNHSGIKGRTAGATFQVPSGTTSVSFNFMMNNAAVGGGQQVVWADPMLQAGQSESVYVEGLPAGPFGSASFAGMMLGFTSGTDCLGGIITPTAITLTGMTVDVATAPAGCSTNAQVGVYDHTAGADLGVTATVSAGRNNLSGLAVGVAAGHEICAYIKTPAAGCSTNPADGLANVQYSVQ
ncbi:MAG TPA: hypothetical protein VKV28_04795 [Candidatus Binataceae bacterium]|nr:hypothetical protein [Candidatus Binataceae bacterium]